MAKRYRSSIPAKAIERVVSPYRRKGGSIWLRKTKCLVGGVVVGERFYDKDGSLQIERPLRNGQVHGIEFHWYEYEFGGGMQSAEPFHEGLPHGTARQWSVHGSLLGTYTLKHGSGFDLWRCECEGRIHLSEVHSMKDGMPHGYEWWLNEDQRSVSHERHWNEGQLHGIERSWNVSGRLSRGYPRYYIKSDRVSKRAYLIARRIDPSLPPFLAIDNEPARRFPSSIAKELGPRS